MKKPYMKPILLSEEITTVSNSSCNSRDVNSSSLNGCTAPSWLNDKNGGDMLWDEGLFTGNCNELADTNLIEVCYHTPTGVTVVFSS